MSSRQATTVAYPNGDNRSFILDPPKRSRPSRTQIYWQMSRSCGLEIMHPLRLSSRRLHLAVTAHHDELFAMNEDWIESIRRLRSSNSDQRVGLPEFQTRRFSKGPKCLKDRSRWPKPLDHQSANYRTCLSWLVFGGLPRFVRNNDQPGLAFFLLPPLR